MQNTNRRIRASKISSPQRGFLLVWEFLLLQIWEEVKATKTVSIQRENKLIKICLKIGVAGTTSSAIFCFRLIGGNFGRLNGVSSSSLESLRRDKLDEVDLLYIVRFKMDEGLILWYLQPELSTDLGEKERKSDWKMVSKTAPWPLLLLLLVSNRKSSDSEWLMPAIRMFHAEIVHDWCLLSCCTLGGWWAHFRMPLEWNTFCWPCPPVHIVQVRFRMTEIQQCPQWKIYYVPSHFPDELILHMPFCCLCEIVFFFHWKMQQFWPSFPSQRLIWLGRWHYCHFLQLESFLWRILHLSATQLST